MGPAEFRPDMAVAPPPVMAPPPQNQNVNCGCAGGGVQVGVCVNLQCPAQSVCQPQAQPGCAPSCCYYRKGKKLAAKKTMTRK